MYLLYASFHFVQNGLTLAVICKEPPDSNDERIITAFYLSPVGKYAPQL